MFRNKIKFNICQPRGGLLGSAAANNGQQGGNVLWAVDFNETLLDTAGLEASLRRWVAELILRNYDSLISDYLPPAAE